LVVVCYPTKCIITSIPHAAIVHRISFCSRDLSAPYNPRPLQPPPPATPAPPTSPHPPPGNGPGDHRSWVQDFKCVKSPSTNLNQVAAQCPLPTPPVLPVNCTTVLFLSQVASRSTLVEPPSLYQFYPALPVPVLVLASTTTGPASRA
jgi:hypothetical protein